MILEKKGKETPVKIRTAHLCSGLLIDLPRSELLLASPRPLTGSRDRRSGGGLITFFFFFFSIPPPRRAHQPRLGSVSRGNPSKLSPSATPTRRLHHRLWPSQGRSQINAPDANARWEFTLKLITLSWERCHAGPHCNVM